MTTGGTGTSNAVAWLVRAAGIELMRRREAHLGAFVLLLFCLGVGLARIAGIRDPADGTLVLNLGMTLACFASHVVALLLASGQLPGEIERRTVHTLLARPLTRDALVVGKWCGVFVWSLVFFGLAFALTWGLSPHMEPCDTLLLVQAFVLQACSLGMMTAWAILFSLLLSRGGSVALCGIFYLAGPAVRAVFSGMTDNGPAERAVSWLLAYLPDFGKLDLVTRYTDGIAALEAGVWLALIGYAALFSVVPLVVAMALFRRRSL